MKKTLILSGLLLLAVVLVANRLAFTLSDSMNIFLCLAAAGLLCAGVLLKKKQQ